LAGLTGLACLPAGERVDVSAPVADAGTPGVDAGTPGVDAGTPGVDAGAPDATAAVRTGAYVAGRWAMREKYSDNVAAELIQTGDILSGTLCPGGLPTPTSGPPGGCGPLTGRVDGRHVRFSAWNFDALVQVDAEISADGSRIGGAYSVYGLTMSTAWSRLADGSGWFDPREGWPPDLLPWSCGDTPYSPGYLLTLVDDPTGSSEFTADRQYLVVFCAGIAGDLGSFGGSDLHVVTVDGHTTTIVAGPVPETTPTLPTQLTLHFENSLLVTVDVVTPSRATYSFRADRSPGGTI
jgi:hypothetical protein